VATRRGSAFLLVVHGLVVPASLALAGCQVIAGVRDITASDGGSPLDGPGHGIDSGDASGAPDTAGPPVDAMRSDVSNGDGSTLPDGTSTAETGTDAARSDTGVDAGTDAPRMDAPTTDSGSPRDSGSGDAGVSYVLIDDMEGNTGEISLTGGNGYWFTYGDGTTGASESPTAGGAFTDTAISPARSISAPFAALSGATSTYGAALSGMGFSAYAGMGFNFENPPPVATYDATAYSGFVFWGRIGGTTTDGTVRFLVPDANTDSSGSICTTCSDYLGKNLTFTTSWQMFTVLYSDLSQIGFGLPKETTLNAAKLFGVQLQVTTKAPAGEAFDVWIDDLYFIKP
jgi:hypothetical protein